jgi:hypothetical protein
LAIGHSLSSVHYLQKNETENALSRDVANRLLSRRSLLSKVIHFIVHAKYYLIYAPKKAWPSLRRFLHTAHFLNIYLWKHSIQNFIQSGKVWKIRENFHLLSYILYCFHCTNFQASYNSITWSILYTELRLNHWSNVGNKRWNVFIILSNLWPSLSGFYEIYAWWATFIRNSHNKFHENRT